jgi:plastocyanin
MNKRGHSSTIALMLVLIPMVMGRTMEPATDDRLDLTGTVALIRSGSGVQENDFSRVVVWLSPLERTRSGRTGPVKSLYRMAQHNKTFEPDMLVVPVGALVDFPNLDPWFHNVFSLYRGKRFDLGLYEARSHREVRFDRQGASYVFCNIHPQMSALVLAVDSEFSAISNRAGRVTIESVPAGRYELHVWYEYANPEILEALSRRVVVSSDSRAIPLISISVTGENSRKHDNKFGQKYDAAEALPSY